MDDLGEFRSRLSPFAEFSGSFEDITSVKMHVDGVQPIASNQDDLEKVHGSAGCSEPIYKVARVTYAEGPKRNSVQFDVSLGDIIGYTDNAPSNEPYYLRTKVNGKAVEGWVQILKKAESLADLQREKGRISLPKLNKSDLDRAKETMKMMGAKEIKKEKVDTIICARQKKGAQTQCKNGKPKPISVEDEDGSLKAAAKERSKEYLAVTSNAMLNFSMDLQNNNTGVISNDNVVKSPSKEEVIQLLRQSQEMNKLLADALKNMEQRQPTNSTSTPLTSSSNFKNASLSESPIRRPSNDLISSQKISFQRRLSFAGTSSESEISGIQDTCTTPIRKRKKAPKDNGQASCFGKRWRSKSESDALIVPDDCKPQLYEKETDPKFLEPVKFETANGVEEKYHLFYCLFIDKEDWRKSKTDTENVGEFTRFMSRCMWKTALKDRALRPDDSGPRYEGQVRLPFTPKKKACLWRLVQWYLNTYFPETKHLYHNQLDSMLRVIVGNENTVYLNRLKAEAKREKKAAEAAARLVSLPNDEA